MVVKGRKSNKNHPILSHEFIIQNHADIVSCIAMVFVVGLMFQATSSLASIFIALHHNVTAPESLAIYKDMAVYSYGLKDLGALFFYLLICIVIHAVIQEYVLDKVNRKLHLSKSKNSKFNESGQLLIFYVSSAVWGGNIIVGENLLLDFPSLWENYPQYWMSFMVKFFYIIQLSYWTHIIPELYFQKIKREEIGSRIQYAILYLVYISGAYLLNFNQVGIWLIILHYASEALFHAARLTYFANKIGVGKILYNVSNVVFVLVHLGSVIISVLTFWYGLALSENQGLDINAGNFNTPLIRLNVLLAVCLLQGWLMWNFINYHLKRSRELVATKQALIAKKKDRKLKKEKKQDSKNSEEDVNELTEVDQNTKRRQIAGKQ